MNRSHRLLSLTVLLSFMILGCGGRGAKTAKTPPPEPVPIDENLLGVLPYETDVVLWVDFKSLKGSPLWKLVDQIFQEGQLEIPGQSAINPLFSCDEAVLGFWESEQLGSQLLVVAKGDETTKKTTTAAVLKNATATRITAEGLDGIKAKDFFLLSLTDRTILFGNEAIVRMAVKAARKEGRSLIENPRYDDFEITGPATAKLRYHRDRNEPLTSSLKNVAPRINPNAVSRIDGEAFIENGVRMEITVKAETQMDASMIAEDLNQTKGQVSKNMMILFFGIEWLLDRVSVVPDKERVRIGIKLDERDIDELGRLMNRLQKLKEMLGNQEGGPLSRSGEQKDPK